MEHWGKGGGGVDRGGKGESQGRMEHGGEKKGGGSGGGWNIGERGGGVDGGGKGESLQEGRGRTAVRESLPIVDLYHQKSSTIKRAVSFHKCYYL